MTDKTIVTQADRDENEELLDEMIDKYPEFVRMGVAAANGLFSIESQKRQWFAARNAVVFALSQSPDTIPNSVVEALEVLPKHFEYAVELLGEDNDNASTLAGLIAAAEQYHLTKDKSHAE